MGVLVHEPDPEQFDGILLLKTLDAYSRGDFTERMPNHWTGVAGKIADTFNAIVDSTTEIVEEYERVGKAVRHEGLVGERIQVSRTQGGWSRLLSASNSTMNDLTAPMEEMTRVVSLVAAGDLRQTMPLETGGFRLQGQFMRTAEIVNNMVGQLNEFSSEVTRVAREVGSEGKLGGQAKAAGVSGTQGNRISE